MNKALRIFQEQFELIQALPPEERAQVLYQAVCNAFENQIEFQNENQIENQFESAYISVSHLGNKIIKLLSKSLVVKEFSSNYGGRRIGAGRPKTISQPTSTPSTPTSTTQPTLAQVQAYAAEQNAMAGVGGFKCTPQTAEAFWSHYQAIGWRISNDNRTPIIDWRPKLRQWAAKDNQAHTTQQDKADQAEQDRQAKLQKLIKGERL